MLRNFLLTTLACLLSIGSAANGGTPTLISHFHARAETKLELSQNECALKLRDKNAIDELFNAGCSTATEQAAADIDFQAAEARRVSAQKYLDFVRNVQQVAGTSSDSSAKQVWLISVPGMQQNQAFKPLATLVIPDNEEIGNRLTSVLHNSTQYSPAHSVSARQELVKRLSKLTDGGIAVRNEIERALLKRDIEQSLTQDDQTVVTLVSSDIASDSFEVDGIRISSEQQLVALLNRFENRMQLVAMQKATEARLAWQKELLARVETASKADATPPLEVQAVSFQVAQLQAQLQQLIAAKDALEQPATSLLVKLNPSPSTQFMSEVTGSELQDACEAALNDLKLTDQHIAQNADQCRFWQTRVIQLEKLCKLDQWFQGELKNAQMMNRIAVATDRKLSFDRDQKQLIYNYTMALQKSATANSEPLKSDWMSPLVALFSSAATSTAHEDLMKQTLAFRDQRHAALSTLGKQGFATWMEVEGAAIQVSQAEASIDKIVKERETLSAVAEVLQNVVNLNTEDSVADLSM